jgi:peptide/nickel transport system ATP-binding protein
MGTLSLRGVDKLYRVGTFGGQVLHAVRDVSFDVEPGQIVSLIGESGSGKSTIGKMILRLTSVSHGSILFDGRDVARLDARELKPYRKSVQGVFQDPFSSYNPIFKADRVFAMIRDVYFGDVGRDEWERRVHDALRSVSLDPDTVLGKYPHQLSGGQLQRMLVARALLLDIEFLVADEVISMLDASTRVDVLNLLGDLKAGGLGVLFITHDLSLGNYISDQAIILRRGRIVERGPTSAVFEEPAHPYTQMLLASVPQLHGGRRQPGPTTAGPGTVTCLYHERFPGGDAAAPASPGNPTMVEVTAGHLVTCATVDEEAGCRQAGAQASRLDTQANVQGPR